MAIYTTKTYDFNPTAGEILLTAFGRCQVRPTELTQTHLQLGQMAENLILVEISNMQPNLWEVELKAIPLQAGQARYSLPSEIVMITDLYIRYGSPSTDRYISPISRTDYASLPNKAQQGFPNQYWFNRRISPEITFYFTPDSNGPYSARYYSVRQTQDVDLANGNTVEVVYKWLGAFTAGVAWELSKIYAPQRTAELFGDYSRSLSIAQTQDVENVPLYLVPGIGGYWR